MSNILARFIKGITLPSQSSDPAEVEEGSLYSVSNPSPRIKAYIQSATREVITNTQSQTLQNKLIIASENTIQVSVPGIITSELNDVLEEIKDGSKDNGTVFILDANELITDWSKGNNATFLGGGTLSGTFEKEILNPLNGWYSYKYTQAAGSLNDYIACFPQAVHQRFRGQTCILSLPFTYSGNSNDIELVIYDASNSTIIPTSLFLESTTNVKIFTAYITIPVNCSGIIVGFKIAVANSGKILNFDDIQLSQTSLYVPQPDYENISLTNGSIAAAAIITNFTVSKNTNKGILSYSSGRITALKTCVIDINYTARSNAVGVRDIQLIKNGSTTVASTTMQANSYTAAISYSEQISIGDYFEFRTDSNGVNNASVYCTAEALSDQILTAPETFSTDTASLTYAGSASYTLSTLTNAPIGTFITFTYATNTNTRTQTTTAPTQFSSGSANANANGILLYTRAFNAPSTAAQPSTIAIQIGKGLKGISFNLYKSSGKITAGNLDYYNVSTSESKGAQYKDYNENTGILLIDAGITDGSGITQSRFNFSDGTAQTSGYLVINASKNPALTGLNVLLPRIATLSDVKASGTAGGTATSGSYQTRTLNTLSDPTGIVTSLVSNQFTLPAGEYYIETFAPSYGTGINKFKIRNVTDSTDSIIGPNNYAALSASGDRSSSSGDLKGNLVISSSKTFELQHRVSSTRATDGYGLAATFGDNEVYSIVKITKVK